MPVLPFRSRVPARLRLPRSGTSAALTSCSVLVTFGFCIFCSIVLLDARQDAARQAEQAAANIGAAVEQDIARNFELLDLSLQAVGDRLQRPEIRDLDPQLRNMVLFDRWAQARYLSFVNALDESGDVVADSRSTTPHAANFAGRDYFIAQKYEPPNNLYVGSPFMHSMEHVGNIPISRRIAHLDGSFAGVVVGSIRLAYFRDLFAKLAVGPHGSITLLRNDGMILMRVPYDPDEIGRTVGSASVFYDFMRTRVPQLEAESQVDHVMRRFNYKQIGDLPLVLSVGFAVDDIFAAWRIKATGILGPVGALCLANLGLTILLRRQLRQRAATESAARRSEAEFRRLTESVSDIVAQIDETGVYRYVSPASIRVLGMPPEALIGRRLADDLHPDDRAAFELWLTRLQHDAAEPTARFRKRRSDGTEVWLEAAASRLIDHATSAPQGFVILSRDVTARHLLDIAQAERARALEQSNAQLAALAEQRAQAVRVAESAVDAAEQAAAVKTRFLATVSHEVRTPLNSRLGYAELLAAEGHLNPVQAGRLTAMRTAGAHLRDVVNQVLDHSRREAEASQSVPVRTDLSALIEQCHMQIEPAATAKGLRLESEIAAGVPRAIFIDDTHLRQVLINLLQNAVKFTQRGGIVLRISSDAKWLRCAVADTGAGVPADRRDRLFREYERLDADHSGIEGTGLGLTIAARLVKGMGGHIGYDDNQGGGAVFWLKVPIGTPAAVPSHMRRRDLVVSKALRVMVVDDSAANRDVAASFLRSAGHVVTEATGGEAAVRLAAAQHLDVVLMDMGMPGMDGLEATRRIRALPGPPGCLPIVALTAQVLDDQWAMWREAGIGDYLAKPYECTELLTTVALAAQPISLNASASPVPLAMESVPRADDPNPLVDPGILAQLETSMTSTQMRSHQAMLAIDIEVLLGLLRDNATETRELEATAHKIAGDAGQLGFSALAATARGYLATLHAGDAASDPRACMLEDVAQRSLTALRQRLVRTRNAVAVSMTLT